MYALFYNWSVEYEASGSNFLCVCETQEIAFKILQNHVSNVLMERRTQLEGQLEIYSHHIRNASTEERLKKQIAEYDNLLDLLGCASYLTDINEIWSKIIHKDGDYSIEEIKLITDPQMVEKDFNWPS